jgi:hypothetical protein
MSLYLCVFASDDIDDEIDGIDVGSYQDFHALRQYVSDHVENGQWGSRFPVLMSHPDSEGEWTSKEAELLVRELDAIQEIFTHLPPENFDGWRADAIRNNGKPDCLADCFVDVDGEPLLERMSALAQLAVDRNRPISFQ